MPSLNRDGLSELVAPILIIMIVLIAGAALYSYYAGQAPSSQKAASVAQSVVTSAFGTQGNSFYAPPQVSVTGASCSNSDGQCTIQLLNTGQSSDSAYSCYLSGSQGVISPNPAEIPAGVSTTITCTSTSGQGTGPGTTVTGEIPMSDGSQLPFSGTWQ